MLSEGLMNRSRPSQYTHLKQQQESQQKITIAVITWNLYGALPPNKSIQILLNRIIHEQFEQEPDAIFFGTQQCQRSIGMSFFCEDKAGWQNLLTQYAHDYVLMCSQNLQGLHNAILIKKDQIHSYTLEKKEVMRAGACNILGNKGAVSIRQNFQFINCHLAPNQTDSYRRNEVLVRMLDELVEKDKRTEVIICGDLNYRIEMEKQYYQHLIKNKKNIQPVMKYSELQSQDQLANQAILKQKFLPFYKEGPLLFPPSYKLQVDANNYHQQKIPGWTDRIFYRSGRFHQLFYECEYNIFGSDHRPITSGFEIEVEERLSVLPNEFVNVNGGNDSCALI